jgi:hypothetical protein
MATQQDDWQIYDAAFGGRSEAELDDALETPWHWLALILLVGAIVAILVFGLGTIK